ncbi:MAG: OmpA family protein [Oscillatoriales cyanobacterium]|uniref:OmpA family protein n=1 Tax=Microcoleus anatoxicus TaxID=2705319 RepID=UPI0029851B69|nr:MAG: OmpA family protein [Oscillatoriales cyanobacterium]
MDEQEDMYVMADPPTTNITPIAPPNRGFKLIGLAVAGIIIIVGGIATYVAIARKPISNQATVSVPAAVVSAPPVSPTPTQPVQKEKTSSTSKPQPAQSNTISPTQARAEKIIIYFPYDDTEITPQQTSQISSFWSKIQGKTGTITVEGHTDDLGEKDYNVNLSQDRAVAVVKILETMGLNNQSQIYLKARGETIPVANNNTETGRALNRRAVIYFSIDK